jgi:hypothetical protein
VLGSNDKDQGSYPKAKEGRGKVMSDVFAAQSLLRDAFPLRRYGKLDNVFFEACRFVNRLVHKDFTPRRARSIWEGTARRIDAEEMEALKAALMEEGHREQRELRARLASLDEKLAGYAAAAHRETMAG